MSLDPTFNLKSYLNALTSYGKTVSLFMEMLRNSNFVSFSNPGGSRSILLLSASSLVSLVRAPKLAGSSMILLLRMLRDLR
jgi:hypothetical protein